MLNICYNFTCDYVQLTLQIIIRFVIKVVLLVKILLQACLLRTKVNRQILVFATFNFILNLVFCIQQHSIYKLKIGLNFAYRRIEGSEFSSLFDDSKYD